MGIKLGAYGKKAEYDNFSWRDLTDKMKLSKKAHRIK
ncbi:MAG: hypothetical protein ACI83B_003020 [Sediminicola sp.]|jgi:hypothetical protein